MASCTTSARCSRPATSRSSAGAAAQIAGLAAALGAALALACGSERDSPESRVRAVLASLERAAQTRDVRAMKEHVSAAYADAYGNDARAIGGIVGLHLLRNESVHLLTRVRSVEIPEPGAARVIAVVAMAGVPIPAPELLPAVRADLYRFELALGEEDGVWRITSAAWRPASIADFGGPVE